MADSETGEVGKVTGDLLYPVKSYAETQNALGALLGGSVVLAIIGLTLRQAGISPGVSAAIGGLGLATAFTQFVLGIVLNTTDPMSKLGVRGKSVSTLLYIIVGFGLSLVLGPATLESPNASVIQFTIGLFITYVAGFTYVRTYNSLTDVGTSARLVTSFLSTVGVVVLLVLLLPEIASTIGQEKISDLITQPPAEIELGDMW